MRLKEEEERRAEGAKQEEKEREKITEADRETLSRIS